MGNVVSPGQKSLVGSRRRQLTWTHSGADPALGARPDSRILTLILLQENRRSELSYPKGSAQIPATFSSTNAALLLASAVFQHTYILNPPLP